MQDDKSGLHSADRPDRRVGVRHLPVDPGNLNLVVLLGIIKVFRAMRQGHYDEAQLEEQLRFFIVFPIARAHEDVSRREQRHGDPV